MPIYTVRDYSQEGFGSMAKVQFTLRMEEETMDFIAKIAAESGHSRGRVADEILRLGVKTMDERKDKGGGWFRFLFGQKGS